MRKLAVVVCLLVSMFWDAGSAVRAQSLTNQIRAYRQAHESEIVGELIELLSVPNVASDSVNIKRNAAMLVGMMSRRGISARLLEGGGPPSVFGELRTPGATQTIGLYAHYDGQPVDPSKWRAIRSNRSCDRQRLKRAERVSPAGQPKVRSGIAPYAVRHQMTNARS
jgi:hypothetical protein